MCLEEGSQSAWLYEILSPHADELVVAAITESKGPKSDGSGNPDRYIVAAVMATS